MNILHITKKYPDALGGDSVVVSNLEKQQWKNGHKVSILTSNCDEIKPKSRLYKFGLKDKPAALDNITPRRLLSLGHLFFKSFQVIRRERPDIIHTHSIDMAFAASIAARIYRVPMVHTFHIVTFHDEKQSWLRRKTELLFKRGANPKVVTAPDQADVDHLIDAGVKNAQLLPNGIDLKFWHDTDTVHNEVVTFIAAGRLEEQKGFEYLIKAAKILKNSTSKPFKVLIAGSGSLQQELGILMMDLDVTDRVELVGRRSTKELRKLYSSSDVAVIPSLYESTPLTLLEAWAVKLPVISTPVGILQGNTQHKNDVKLVPVQDEKALARAMRELLEKKDKRDKLAKRGHEAVQQYAWSEIYKTAEAMYEGVLAEKPTQVAAAEPKADMVAAPAQQAPVDNKQVNERNLMLGMTAISLGLLGTAGMLSGTINAFATLPLAVLVPGLLLRLGAFRELAGKALAATLSIASALGILLITVESLLANWLLPVFGVDDPLRAAYLVPLHMLLTLVLLGIYLQKYGNVAKETVYRLHISFMQTVRFVVPLLLPLLAAAGAFRQNNGFGNEITLIALAAMAIMAIWFVAKPTILNPVWLLFNIALGLLLSTSLRSWFVSGFDIAQEFQVFNLALQNHHWDLNAIPGNAYNACLSLTTLPAALAEFSGITAEYIFKYFYQIVFALTAVVIYLLGRRFADTRGAFLVGLFYVAQAQFIGTMPAIVRQQIGLLFFALIVYLLIEKGKLTKANAWLMGLLGAGIVVSHYSTTYVAIFILAATAAVLWALRIKPISRRLPAFNPMISAVTVSVLAVMLIAMSFLWYSVINASSSNVKNTLSRSWQALIHFEGFTYDKNGTRTQLLLGGSRESTPPENVYKYKEGMSIPEDIKPTRAETLPVKNEAATWVADRLRDFLSVVVKVLLPVSPLILLLVRRTRTEVADLAFLGVGSLATFVAFFALPALSQSYNIERVLQQALVILSITGLWAMWVILPRRKMLNTTLTCAFVLLFFVLSPGTGLANQIIGGTTPRMNLNSLGEEYQKYYVSEGEVRSAQFLRDNCQREQIWADRYATLRVTAYAGAPYDSIESDILKMDTGCLMLDRANVEDNLYYAHYKGLNVRYTIPDAAFNRHNLIYSNSSAQIYQR